jgi:polyferredoxin
MDVADSNRLLAVKLLHTAVWAFFAGCILAIPILGWKGQLLQAGVLCGIVFIEVLVVVFNGWRCPLTPVAARYTTDRRANFDIFLPEWLARHNKTIFGGLYFAGLMVVAYRWLG